MTGDRYILSEMKDDILKGSMPTNLEDTDSYNGGSSMYLVKDELINSIFPSYVTHDELVSLREEPILAAYFML